MKLEIGDLVAMILVTIGVVLALVLLGAGIHKKSCDTKKSQPIIIKLKGGKYYG